MNHPELVVSSCPIEKLRTSRHNARTHSRKQLAKIRRSIERFGFVNPLLVREDNTVVCGHGRLTAAKALGFRTVPTISISHLSDTEVRAYMLADNKIALEAGWDPELLAIEFEELSGFDFDVTVTGFEIAEIDFVIAAAQEAAPSADDQPEDRIPTDSGVEVCKPGDGWLLGRHRLRCGDARDPQHVASLMKGDVGRMAFLDPPWNLKVDRNLAGNGKTAYREFAFASGEMTRAEFTTFLADSHRALVAHLIDGAIVFVCSDWRHSREMLDAGEAIYTEQKNLLVWNKGSGSHGSFYRSQHELIFVFKHGTAPHTNTFGLGETGRYRTNVLSYPGMSSFGKDREKLLATHPTCKPVALVADLIKDCSAKGEIVVDLFCGSGTTLIAAETTGRVARVIEYDPRYCDTIIRRWQGLTGRVATREGDGASFQDLEIEQEANHG